MITRALFATCLLTSSAFAATAAKDEGHVVERIVALVNDEIVLFSELESAYGELLRVEQPPAGVDADAWRAEKRREVLDALIAERLITAEVRKLRVDVTDAEVDRVVKSTMEQHKLDEATLTMALDRQGLTLLEYKDGLRKQLMKMKIIQLKVKNRVQVTDQDVRSTYNQSRAGGPVVSRLKARHILFLVDDESRAAAQKKAADAALVRAKAGEDFSKLAEELSEDAASAKRGGALGEFGRGEMVPAFEQAAFAALPGEVTAPVRSPFGWHLILVDERIQDDAGQTEDKALEAIRQRLYESEVETQFQRYVDELRRQASIEVRL